MKPELITFPKWRDFILARPDDRNINMESYFAEDGANGDILIQYGKAFYPLPLWPSYFSTDKGLRFWVKETSSKEDFAILDYQPYTHWQRCIQHQIQKFWQAKLLLVNSRLYPTVKLRGSILPRLTSASVPELGGQTQEELYLSQKCTPFIFSTLLGPCLTRMCRFQAYV